MKNFYKKGITVIEILIVVAILGIIIGVALPQFRTMRQNEVLKSTVSDVVSAIDKAQSESIASINSSEYGIHFAEDAVTIFEGTSYDELDSSNIVILLTTPAEISDIDIDGGGSDVYFDRLSGEPSHTGSVTISVSTLSRTITISATGSVSVN